MDDDLFPVLESYLQDLHAGQRPDREALVSAHPELAGALQCLEDLQRLAPAADSRETAEYSPDPFATAAGTAVLRDGDAGPGRGPPARSSHCPSGLETGECADGGSPRGAASGCGSDSQDR